MHKDEDKKGQGDWLLYSSEVSFIQKNKKRFHLFSKFSKPKKV